LAVQAMSASAMSTVNLFMLSLYLTGSPSPWRSAAYHAPAGTAIEEPTLSLQNTNSGNAKIVRPHRQIRSHYSQFGPAQAEADCQPHKGEKE
jgi:hypothetical protein